MKPLFSLGLALLTISVSGGDIPLAWDSPTNEPTAAFILYASTNALSAANFRTAPVRLPLPPINTVTLSSFKPGTYWITVTAVSTNTLESDPSNILVAQVPTPPVNLRTVLLQYSNTITNAGTNWVDAGFFRVKIGP